MPTSHPTAEPLEPTEAVTGTPGELEMLLRYPEKNQLDSAERLFRLIGAVTRKNAAGQREGMPERPLSVRRERARLYKLFKAQRTGPALEDGSPNPEDRGRQRRKAILGEASDRDELLKQYLKQGDVGMDRPDIGKAAAKYTVVNPPPGREIPGAPPIVFIPGISNDLGSVDHLIQEMAFKGRKVVVIAYPDSQMGTVSPEFAAAAEASPGFQAHVAFFRDAIDKLLPGEENIELHGFSTGGPIVMEMLAADRTFAQKVPRAVLINPASVVKQSSFQLWTGMAKEMKGAVLNPKEFSAYGLVVARDGSAPPEADGQRDLKKRVFGALFERVCRPLPNDFREARVREGGDIVVVSGTSDEVTKCHDRLNSHTQLPNPQMKVIDFNGNHMSPLVKSAKMIDQIAKV